MTWSVPGRVFIPVDHRRQTSQKNILKWRFNWNIIFKYGIFHCHVWFPEGSSWYLKVATMRTENRVIHRSQPEWCKNLKGPIPRPRVSQILNSKLSQFLGTDKVRVPRILVTFLYFVLDAVPLGQVCLQKLFYRCWLFFGGGLVTSVAGTLTYLDYNL
jgi:hypothetical protein